MKTNEARNARERRTIDVMIRMYCHDNHKASAFAEASADRQPPGEKEGLCRSCSSLLAYAMERIDKCPFLEDKPTCLKCPVHCYKPDRREEVRRVMRYSGPRMILRHPYMAVMHLIDGLRKQSEVRSPKSEVKSKR